MTAQVKKVLGQGETAALIQHLRIFLAPSTILLCDAEVSMTPLLICTIALFAGCFVFGIVALTAVVITDNDQTPKQEKVTQLQ